ncbi:hypothetical protein SAMN04487981_1292 [Streptomyces sp. cf386]|uniref:hypothetical protein n=1 Tax=Streptomyces sp. cf386 TaxID=1761904 RepID=UPI00088AA29E|nr:hypothetical protein [Streptomyces sp. cf386]SDP61514.1 hypothetical protein SAMN04487981_1292 [Streptomyces sp. cf386]
MSASKAPEGPFPYPTTSEWAENLYQAITNTCAAEGFAPVPRQAVLEALAPALGQGEAKRVIERRRDGRVLRATAYHVEQRGTDGALLLLNVALHGAATLPWANNDRTRSEWLHPSPDNLARMEELVDQQRAVAEWTMARERAKGAQRALAAAAPRAEKDAAVAAVKHAEDELARAQRELKVREQALGGRRPLPVVRAVVEDGKPAAALTTEEVRAEVAGEVQRYAVEMLQRRARLRSYDLAESLVQEGQREPTVVVLQRTPVVGRDGSRRHIWRGRQVTGNNRADARLLVHGLVAHQVLTGVPQYLLRLEEEEENRRLVLLGLGEILRRVSTLLNTEYADPERDPEGRAERALRTAQVPARVVVGARTPERLEESLRQLNVHDHLRGQLNYGDMDRSLGLWSTLVKAYQAKGVLRELLAQEVAQGRIGAGDLDEDAIADALVGARPLDELAVLLTPGDEVSPLTLRDVAVRCATVMVFPPVPPRPENLPPRAHMPTGRYWPVVRTALQEASWALSSTARTDRRTDVWAAVVAQHFAHRGNPLAARGLFTARDVQHGARPDTRSLASLLTACRKGDAEAWETLVRRHLVPGLINSPEPFVTAGQGSEKGEDRKGVRRTPVNAVQALVNAYTAPPQGVTRELLIAFAEAVLQAPELARGSGLLPGTFWAPDAHGNPREGTLADKGWYDTTFPKIASSRKRKRAEPPVDDSAGDESDKGEESGTTTEELDEEVLEDAVTRMTRLRSALSSMVSSSADAVATATEQIGLLLATIEDAVRAREEAGADEEPAEVQKSYVKELREIKKQCGEIVELLDSATVEVTSL